MECRLMGHGCNRDERRFSKGYRRSRQRYVHSRWARAGVAFGTGDKPECHPLAIV